MKVLFVNPPNMPFNEKSLLIEPIDIITVASYVKALGHGVKLIDMDVKQMQPEWINEIIEIYLPEVTVITFDYHIPLHTSNAIEGINKIISIAKNNNSKVIVSGKTAKYYPEIFLKNGADLIIRGEMELTLKELLNVIDWSANNLLKIKSITYIDGIDIVNTQNRTEFLDLNTLPIADRSLIDLNDYIDVRTILSSRGCVGKCSFCPTPDFWGKWRGKNATNVVDEIEYLVNKLRAKKILFLDDNATVNKQRMQNISQEIITRGIKVALGCLGTISNYDKKTLQMMYNAGFRWIHYGIETASQKVLINQGKDFKIEYAKKVISETKEIGLKVRTSFILDLPEIDEQGIKETIDFILETQPDEIRLHYLSLRVGTKIYQEMANKKLMPSQYIHSQTPTYCNDDIKEKINIGVEMLLDKLKEKGYLIITHSSQFKDIKANINIKFVSFCPSKYGLNWGDVK